MSFKGVPTIGKLNIIPPKLSTVARQQAPSVKITKGVMAQSSVMRKIKSPALPPKKRKITVKKSNQKLARSLALKNMKKIMPGFHSIALEGPRRPAPNIGFKQFSLTSISTSLTVISSLHIGHLSG